MIETLHSFRFLFVVLVFFSHFVWEGHVPFDYGGECGVSFFFILSGFVLSVGYGGRLRGGVFSEKTFLLKQLCKFYPLHIVMTLFFMMLDMRTDAGVDWVKLLLNLFLLQSWLPDNGYNFAFNGVSWFLSDMLLFYLLFPVLFRKIDSMPSCQLWGVTFVGIAAYFVLVLLVPQSAVNTVLYVFPPVRCLDFILGILVYRVYAGCRELPFLYSSVCRRGFIFVTVFELAVVLLLVSSYLVYGSLPSRIRCVGLFWFVLPLLILFFAIVDKCGGTFTRLLHSRVLLWLGGVSFEVFLLHLAVIRLFTGAATRIGLTSLSLYEYIAASLLCLGVTVGLAVPVKKYFVDNLYSVLIKAVIKV